MQPAAPAPQYPHSSMQIAKLSASLSSPNGDPTLYPILASADHSHSDVSSTAYSHQSQHRLWDSNTTLNHNDNSSGSLFNNPTTSLSIPRVPDLSPGSSTDHSSVRTPLDMQSMPPPLQDMYTGKIISEDDWLHYKAVPAYEESTVASRSRRTPSMSTTVNTEAPSSSHDQQSTVSARSAYSSRPSLSSVQFQQQQPAYVPRHSSEPQVQSSPQVAIPQHSPPNPNSSSNNPEGQATPSHSQFHPAQTYQQQQQQQQEQKQKPDRPRLLIEQPVSFSSHSKSQQASSLVQPQPQQQQPQSQVGAPMHNGQHQAQAYPQSQQDFHSRRSSWNPETSQPSSTSSLSHILASSTINPSPNIVLTQEQRWIQQMHLEQQQQAMRQQSLQQQHSAAQYSESNSWVPRTAANNINGSVNGNGQPLTVNANLNIALNLGNGVHAYSHHPSQSQQLPPSTSAPQAYSTAGGVMGSLQSYGQGQHAAMVAQQQRITSQPQYFVSPQQPSGQQRRFAYDQPIPSTQQQMHHQQQRIESPQVFSYGIDSVPQHASYQTTHQSVSTFMPIQSNHQQALPQSHWAPYSAPPFPYPREPPPTSNNVGRRHSQYTIEPPSTSSSRKRSASPITETTAVSHGGMVFGVDGAKRRKYSPPSSLNPVLNAAVAQAEDAHARLVSWREEASAATAAPQEGPIQTRSSASVSTRASSSARAVKAAKGRDAGDESDQDAEGEDENKDEDEEDASDYVDDGDDEEYDPHESKSRKTASRSRRGRPPGSTKKASATRSVRATRSTSQAVPTSPTLSKPAAKATPGRRGRQARGS